MAIDIIPTNEVEGYRLRIQEAEHFSTSLVVKTDEDYEKALVEARTIKKYKETVTSRKEEITKPLNAAVKSARDLFKPIEDRLDGAYETVKMKMLAFHSDKEAKAAQKNAKIDARVEKGTLSESDAGVKKFMNQVDKTVSTESGSATMKKVKKYYVIDKSQVPLDFLEVDMTKVKASFKSGFPVPGVEERIENELAIS